MHLIWPGLGTIRVFHNLIGLHDARSTVDKNSLVHWFLCNNAIMASQVHKGVIIDLLGTDDRGKLPFVLPGVLVHEGGDHRIKRIFVRVVELDGRWMVGILLILLPSMEDVAIALTDFY